MDRKEEQCGYQNYEKSMCKPPAFTHMQNGSVSHDGIDQFHTQSTSIHTDAKCTSFTGYYRSVSHVSHQHSVTTHIDK